MIHGIYPQRRDLAGSYITDEEAAHVRPLGYRHLERWKMVERVLLNNTLSSSKPSRFLRRGGSGGLLTPSFRRLEDRRVVVRTSLLAL